MFPPPCGRGKHEKILEWAVRFLFNSEKIMEKCDFAGQYGSTLSIWLAVCSQTQQIIHTDVIEF